MSNAYKCDGCGEFFEGESNRYVLRRNDRVGLAGLTDSTVIEAVEACDECSKSLETFLTEWTVSDSSPTQTTSTEGREMPGISDWIRAKRRGRR